MDKRQLVVAGIGLTLWKIAFRTDNCLPIRAMFHHQDQLFYLKFDQALFV